MRNRVWECAIEIEIEPDHWIMFRFDPIAGGLIVWEKYFGVDKWYRVIDLITSQCDPDMVAMFAADDTWNELQAVNYAMQWAQGEIRPYRPYWPVANDTEAAAS